MLPTEQRIQELRTRFCVHHGDFYSEYRYKNLNWYLASGVNINRDEPGEWFCYSDIRDEDVPRLQALLQDGEILVLGWKDLGPNELANKYRKGTVTLAIANAGVVYDVRRDGPIKET